MGETSEGLAAVQRLRAQWAFLGGEAEAYVARGA